MGKNRSTSNKTQRSHVGQIHENALMKIKDDKTFMDAKYQVKMNQCRCIECGMVFTDLRIHNRHFRNIHRKEPPALQYECGVCGKIFKSSSKLKRHNFIHETHGHKCPTCDKTFNRKDHLLKHQKIHEPSSARRYLCDLCKKGFNEKYLLQRHINSHTGHRPYACGICNNRYFTDTTLKQHLLTHSDVKPFLCPTCGSSFKRKGTLDQHMLSHTQERPFSCDICHRRFNSKSTMVTHKRVHTGEMPYSCNRCGECFARSDILKYHVRRKTDCKTGNFFRPERTWTLPDDDNNGAEVKPESDMTSEKNVSPEFVIEIVNDFKKEA